MYRVSAQGVDERIINVYYYYYYYVQLQTGLGIALAMVGQLVSWYFEPSQPQAGHG